MKKAKIVICCEGAISHVSNAFKIKTIALVDDGHIKTAMFWTKHMENINLIYRKDVKEICKSIKNI